MPRQEVKKREKMAENEQEEGGSGEIAGWVVTFSDLMTLLLTFFVLLLSMSSLDRQNISRIFSMLPGKSGILNRQAWNGNKELPDQEWNYNRLSELMTRISELQRKKESEIRPGDIKIISKSKGMVLIIANKILFEKGKATLSPKAKQLLDVIGDFLDQCSNRISIEGHSDNTPIKTAQFPSNWELSGARALSVLEYFTRVRGMPSSRFRIAAFGDTRPLVPNTTERNRAMNRRIEIVILNNKQ